jgi:hypothetical protein
MITTIIENIRNKEIVFTWDLNFNVIIKIGGTIFDSITLENNTEKYFRDRVIDYVDAIINFDIDI